MKHISKEVYELAKIFTLVTNAQLRVDVLLKEKTVTGGAKHFIKTTIYNRLTAIIRDVEHLFRDNPEDLKAMREDILNMETALQTENINNMVLALPQGIRDEIEKYVEQRLYVYSSKVA